MNGVELIAAERKRQVEAEGWTPEHDNEHAECELLAAAVNYLELGEFVSHYGRTDGETFFHGHPPSRSFRWPFSKEWWKPDYQDPVRNLIKAGALIAAEIDRLLRKKGTTQ